MNNPHQETSPTEGESDPLDEAFAAYLRSCDTGDFTSREAFLAQFPELADQLKELIDAADMIGQFTSGDGHDSDVAASETASHQGSVGHANDPSAETIGINAAGGTGFSGDGFGGDPAATLPMANRAEGDPGPTLPFDLGDYLLLDVIGRGGMGVVYRAKQSELDREVAVKMIRSGMLASEDEVRRFYIEAQAAARLHHPGIVSVFQFGRRVGHHFFSMEYVRGTDLQRKINNEQLTVHDAARYVRDVARAIHHAHEKGVLHRDLKPANVLIDEHGAIHVTDFGLAKHMDCDSSVTGSGAAVGTPHYMAPEQAGGHSDRASCQSDVYSLGAILFAALTGRPPLVGDTVMQTLVRVVHDPAPPVRSIRRDVPADIETIVAKCLEKKTINRYASAGYLADELDAFLEDRPIEARPRSAAMRTWNWIEGVPLVGALMGRRILHASDTHRRFQAAMLMLMISIPILTVGALAFYQQHVDDLPATVRIAGGIDGGRYNEVATQLADRISAKFEVETIVVRSGGSLANRDRLLKEEIELAPMQATSIHGDHLCVVAPLFYELLHVLARNESDIRSVQDIRGHGVAVGPATSGSNATAELIFDSLGFRDADVRRHTGDWNELFSDAADQPFDAAMICMGRGSDLVQRLIKSGRWRIVPIEEGIQISLQHPTLRPMTIRPEDVPGMAPIDVGFQASRSSSSTGWPTVGTTAFLAARDDAPAEMVIAMLDALYAPPRLQIDLIPRRHAAEWQGLAFHRAARQFYRHQPVPSQSAQSARP